MALLKCKICGGSLDVAAGETVIECEYCGTLQTLPKTTDENIQSLFNRANLLRQKNEFDKAEAIYEKILEVDDTEAEAYWGVILCKFGIEYVEDPKTYKRMSTCHRTSYDSIIADEYYKRALQYADATSRAMYEAEAKKIDEIQKGILAISAQEDPYDVFICYKETDGNGNRTPDSVIASDIYYHLTQEGFKVFYAAITLEDKLGNAYEPIIFAALNSAKVMLSIGTKPEYFTAVWVKNEWSRFLKMMKNDRSKVLIPCYRGMDAYELPEEFAHLQAQDMGKIGFINDVIRGIRKIVGADAPKATIQDTFVTSPGPANVAPLLKRAYMFLEDENWASANEYCEKVLDIDPENAMAYLGKLMVELKVKNREALKDCATPFDNLNSYQKAIRFADDDLKSTLIGCIEHIKTRNANAHKQKIYENAVSEMRNRRYSNAAHQFEQIIGYKDSQVLAKECLDASYTQAKDHALSLAKKLMAEHRMGGYQEAITKLVPISGWKDADEQLAICQQKIKEMQAQAEAECKERARLQQLRAKRKKTIATIAISAICAAVLIASVLYHVIIPSTKYNKALALMESGDYVQAYPFLADLAEMGRPWIGSIADQRESLRAEVADALLREAEAQYLQGDAASAAALVAPLAPQIEPGYKYVAQGKYQAAIACGLTHISLPNGTTEIPNKAFEKCLDLKAVTIPNSVTRIGGSAFAGCLNLTSIEIPDSVTIIGGSAFYGCTDLVSIEIPKGVSSIQASAFMSCKNLTSVKIPNSVTSIGDYAFYRCSNLPSIVIPDGVTSIGNNAFYGCSNLTSIVIPDSMTYIGDGAFSNCTSLTSITFAGTMVQWKSFSHGWNISSSITQVICSDGTIRP